MLLDLSDQVARRLRQAGFAGRTIALSIRDPSFRTITRLSQLSSATHHRFTDRQNIGPAFAHRPEGGEA